MYIICVTKQGGDGDPARPKASTEAPQGSITPLGRQLLLEGVGGPPDTTDGHRDVEGTSDATQGREGGRDDGGCEDDG